MSLKGNLEDLPLLDIIQIVSFSKKTGYLSIRMEEGEGGIVFAGGFVVCAFTAASPPLDPSLPDLPPEKQEQILRSRIVFALEQLARLREGAFAFELADEVPCELGSRDITLETLAGGINPQNLLLDLATGMDEGQAQSAAAVEASFAAPEEGAFGAGAEESIVPSGALLSDLESDLESSNPLAGLSDPAPPPGPAPVELPPPRAPRARPPSSFPPACHRGLLRRPLPPPSRPPRRPRRPRRPRPRRRLPPRSPRRLPNPKRKSLRCRARSRPALSCSSTTSPTCDRSWLATSPSPGTGSRKRVTRGPQPSSPDGSARRRRPSSS